MELSKLQLLANNLTQGIRKDPSNFILKLIPEDKIPMYKSIRAMLNNPLLSSFIPVKVEPESLILGVVDKLAALPPEAWAALEAEIRGVLDGEPEAMERALKMFGVVVDGN